MVPAGDTGRWITEVCGMGPDVSVIIPVFNEEGNLIPLYEELSAVLSTLDRTHEIIFVDDGSTDRSFSCLQGIHDRDPTVKIIKFRKNFGQSAALKAGFDRTTGSVIITMDSDLQNDPNDIPELIKKLEHEHYDVVCGWRRHRTDTISKKIFSRSANKLRTLMTGESIHDSGCTLRAYTRESVADIELYGELHRYLPALLLWKGYRIGEMETNHRERNSGKSKYNWQRLVKGFLDLLVVTFWQKYSARPMHVFGGLGLVMGGLGVLITLYLGISRVVYGTGLTDRPLFLVGLVLLIVGIEFIGLGIIADILLKIYYGQNERKTYLVEKVVE
jgi:glycosyltransferase involved in cell wall biosynthesis